MSYIDDLRQRVETAEQGFGLIGEQHRKYSERLIDLMNTVDESQRLKQAQIDRLTHENEQVRAMLHALLLAVEEGSRDRLSDAMRLLDARATELVSAATPPIAAPPPAVAEATAAPAVDDAAEDIVAEEPVEDVAAEEPAEAVAAEEPVEDVAAEDPAEGIVAGQAFEDVAAEVAAADIVVEDVAAEQAFEDVAAEHAAANAAPEPAVEAAEAAPAASAPASVAAIIQRISEKTRDMLEADAPPAAAKPKAPARRSA